MSNFESELSKISEPHKNEFDELTEELTNQLKYLRRAHRFIEIWRRSKYRNLDDLDFYLIKQSKLRPSTFSYVMNRVKQSYQDIHQIFIREELENSAGDYVRNLDGRDFRTYMESHLNEILSDDQHWASKVIKEQEYYKKYQNTPEWSQQFTSDTPIYDLFEETEYICESIGERYSKSLEFDEGYMSDGGTSEIESIVYDGILVVGCGIAITYDGATLNPMSVGMALMTLAGYAQTRR